MSYQILLGDARTQLQTLPDDSVQCCVTSPPYFNLRDYGMAGQIGQENSLRDYVDALVDVFRGVRRVLKDDGLLWVNLGDTYAANRTYQVPSTKGGPKHATAQGNLGGSVVPAGLKPKDLMGIPWRVAFALQDDGWYLRQDIIWHKPNPMPESVKTRCTKSHEYIFMLSKQPNYYFNAEAIAEPIAESSRKRYQHAVDTEEKFDPTRHKHTAGVQSPMELLTRAAKGVLERGVRNRRSVWKIATQSFAGAHFATFPLELPTLCIKASTKPGDTVLDVFSGAGTTGVAAMALDRHYLGIELNPEYASLSEQRLRATMSESLFTDN